MAEQPLTELQRTVLEVFFALPESDGFVLAGGAALVATGLTDRPTNDIDLFGADRSKASHWPQTRSRSHAPSAAGRQSASGTTPRSVDSSFGAPRTSCS